MHLMHEELQSSTEKSRQHHYLNLNLLQQREDLVKELDHHRRAAANGKMIQSENQHLHGINEALQKRVLELEKERNGQCKVRPDLSSPVWTF
jgi:uncharacterized protein YajQ (UPF0234 family)